MEETMANVMGGIMVARALKKEGVKCIFTLSGGHIAPIYMACNALGIKVIDLRHEQAAAHAADAYTRITGKPGVAVVTAGPGVTDAVTGITNAWFAKSPMILIGGHAPYKQEDMGPLQDMDHTSLMKPVTKWSKCVSDTERIPE